MDLAQQTHNHRRADSEEDASGLDVSILILAVVSGLTMLVLTIISCICCYRQGNRRYSSRNDSRRDTVPLEDLLSKPSLADPESVFSEASYDGHLSVHTGSWLGLSGESSTVVQESVSYSGPSSEGRECASFNHSMKHISAEDSPSKHKKWSSQSQKNVNVRSLQLIRAQEREQQLKRFSGQNEVTPMMKALDDQLQAHRSRSPPKFPSEVKFSTEATNVVTTGFAQKNESRKDVPAKVDVDLTGLKVHRDPLAPDSHSFLSSTRCSFSHEVGHIALGNKVPRTSLPRTDEPEEEEGKSSDEDTQPESRSEKADITCLVTTEQNKASYSSNVTANNSEKIGNSNTAEDAPKSENVQHARQEDSDVLPEKISNNIPAKTLPSPISNTTGDVTSVLNTSKDNLLPSKSKTSIQANITHSTADCGECDHERVAMRRSLSCVPGAGTCSTYHGGTRRKTFSLNLKIDFHFDEDRGSREALPTVVCLPCTEYNKYDKRAAPANNATTGAATTVQAKLKNSNEIMNTVEADDKEKLLEQSFATKSTRMNNQSPEIILKRSSEPAIPEIGHFDLPSIHKINRRFSAAESPFLKGGTHDHESRIHRPTQGIDSLGTGLNMKPLPTSKREPSSNRITETDSASRVKEQELREQEDSTFDVIANSQPDNDRNSSRISDESTCCVTAINPSSDEELEDGAATNREADAVDEMVVTAEGGDDGMRRDDDKKSKSLCDDTLSVSSNKNVRLRPHDESEESSSDVHNAEDKISIKSNVGQESVDLRKGVYRVGAQACKSNTEFGTDHSLSLQHLRTGANKEEASKRKAQVFPPVSPQRHPVAAVERDKQDIHSSANSAVAHRPTEKQAGAHQVSQDDSKVLSVDNCAEPKKKRSAQSDEAKDERTQEKAPEVDADKDNVTSSVKSISEKDAQNDETSAVTSSSRPPKIAPRKVHAKPEAVHQISEDSEIHKHGHGNSKAILIASSRKKMNETDVGNTYSERRDVLESNRPAEHMTFTSKAENVKHDESSNSPQNAENSENRRKAIFESSAKHTTGTEKSKHAESIWSPKDTDNSGKPIAAPRRQVKDTKHTSQRRVAENEGLKLSQAGEKRHPSENTVKNTSRIPVLYFDDDDAEDDHKDSSKTAQMDVSVKHKTSVSSAEGHMPVESNNDDSFNNNNSYTKSEEITSSSEAVEASDDSDYDNPWDNLDDAVKRASIRYNRRPSRIAAGEDKTLLLKSAEDLGRLLEEADKKRQLRQAAARSSCQVLSPDDNTESMTIPFTRFSPHRHTVKGIVSQPYLATSQSSENILKDQVPTFPKLSLLRSEDSDHIDRGIDARRPKSLTSKVRSKISSPESKKRKK